jgi:hypothetical protein
MRSNHKTRLALFFATSTTLLLLGGCSNSVDYYKAHEKEARTKERECRAEIGQKGMAGKLDTKTAAASHNDVLATYSTDCGNAGEAVKHVNQHPIVAMKQRRIVTR